MCCEFESYVVVKLCDADHVVHVILLADCCWHPRSTARPAPTDHCAPSTGNPTPRTQHRAPCIGHSAPRPMKGHSAQGIQQRGHSTYGYPEPGTQHQHSTAHRAPNTEQRASRTSHPAPRTHHRAPSTDNPPPTQRNPTRSGFCSG